MTPDPVERFLKRRGLLASRLFTGSRSGLPDLLDASITGTQALAKKIYPNCLAPTALIVLVAVFLIKVVWPQFFYTSAPNEIWVQVAEASAVLVILVVVGLPILAVGLALVSGFCSLLVAQYVQGVDADSDQCLATARKALPKLVLCIVLMMVRASLLLLIAFGLLVLSAVFDAYFGVGEVAQAMAGVMVLVAVFLSIFSIPYVISQYSLAPVSVVLESASPREALRRSKELLKGTRYANGATLRPLGLLLAIAFVALIGFGGLWSLESLLGIQNFIEGLLLNQNVASVLSAMVSTLLFFLAIMVFLPFYCVGCALLYFDRRVRHDGLDVEMLARGAWKQGKESRFEV
ncbi:MAG: hypothetical protein ACK4P3_07045 [Fimbriimonadaceae bacterium]